jgi:hypothetical protein
MTKRLFAIVFLFACAHAPHASAYSGAELEAALENEESVRAGIKLSEHDFYLVGYAKGFVRGTGEALGARGVCLPADAGVTAGQAEAIVLKYLKANPELWHKNAVDLVAVALMAAFPCAK